MKQLNTVIKDAVDAQLFFETSSTLCFEDDSIISDVCTVDEDFENDFEEFINDNGKNVKVDVDFEYKKNTVEYWKSGVTKKLKLTTVQNQFRKLKGAKMLYRWESEVENGGNRIHKLNEICMS